MIIIFFINRVMFWMTNRNLHPKKKVTTAADIDMVEENAIL